MPPPASSFKKPPKKEEPKLTAVLILDVFDQRFAPIFETYPCLATLPICNVSSVNFCLSWLMRTEVKTVMLVVSGLNVKHAENIQKDWKMAFEELVVVSCDGATSVGDCMREVHNRELITGDFLLITNPTSVVSTTLATQISEFRKRRRENQDNVMTLLYSNRENPEHFVIGVQSETNKLMLYPGANSLNQLKAEKKDFHEGLIIRRDITHTGIAFCSRLIANQFSDNFDFTTIDDVVRELLSKDDILGMSVHVDVLPPTERAFCAYDYESLILLNTLLLERYFYPVVPENTDLNRTYSCNPLNVYLEDDHYSVKANTWILDGRSRTVALGLKSKVAQNTVIENSSVGPNSDISAHCFITGSVIGENCGIGENCRIEFAFIGNNVVIPPGTHISKETIIGNGVHFPKDLPSIQYSAVLKSSVNEEIFDRLSSHSVGSCHVAKLRSGGPFWRRSVNGRTNFSVDDEDSEIDDPSGEDTDDGIDDSTRQFHEEVFDSMQKILESENQVMRNLILEINSSKLACNVSMDDVAKNVFAAFLKLPHNREWAQMRDLITQWRDLFVNYYTTTPESLRVKTPDQQRFEIELKKKCQIQLLLSIEDKYEKDEEFLPRVPLLVHHLYNSDLVEEEAILEWHTSIDLEEEGKEELRQRLSQRMQPIIDWLQEEDEDEEEDDE